MERPENISQIAWDKARSALSAKFTNPINNQILELLSLAKNINDLESYDFKFVTWEEFLAAEDRPDGILERANDWRNDNVSFDFVVYDPLDDEMGFFLMANDAQELAREACQYIVDVFPEEGPLSEANLTTHIHA